MGQFGVHVDGVYPDVETGQVYTVLYDIQKRKRVREYRFDDASIGNGGVAFDPLTQGSTTVEASIPGFITTGNGTRSVTVGP